jgi:uncharacterized protein YkwD
MSHMRRKVGAGRIRIWCKGMLWGALAWIMLCAPPVGRAETTVGTPESHFREGYVAHEHGAAQEMGTDAVLLTVKQRRLILKLVNNARVAGRKCGSRFYRPTHRLIWDSRLARAAQRHSNDMANNNFFSHTGSDGSLVWDRIDDTGYDWQTCGENIAAGYPSIRDAVNGWLNSPGHCANIMDPNFEEMGAAKANNVHSDYGIYWTQVFAAPLN